MYVQDEKQRNVGNLDIPDGWAGTYDTSRMWTIIHVMPQIGALVTYQDQAYQIIRTETHQEEDVNPRITTFCVIVRIDDEGDQLDIESIMVKADELTLI